MKLRFPVLPAFLLGAALCHAQVVVPGPSQANFDIDDLNGIPVHGDARGIPNLDYTSAISVAVQGGYSVLHRMIVDRTHHLYFGYDLEALKVQGTSQVHLHFTPLTALGTMKGIDLSLYARGAMSTPPDKTVDIGAIDEVPLEQDQSGNTILRDHLNFGPPNP